MNSVIARQTNYIHERRDALLIWYSEPGTITSEKTIAATTIAREAMEVQTLGTDVQNHAATSGGLLCIVDSTEIGTRT